jgi:hypothetical protein
MIYDGSLPLLDAPSRPYYHTKGEYKRPREPALYLVSIRV